MKKHLFLILSVVFCLSSHAGNEQTSIKSGEIWYDTSGKLLNAHGGGILYYNETYYWYGEYKGDSTYWNPKVPSWECYRTEAGGVSCYSSKDLYNWKFEGLVLKPDTQNPKSDLHTSQVIERPKVIYNKKTKKFVMWLHIDSDNYAKAAAGVAVCDSPTGQFTYKGSFRPNESMSRDMTVFKDTDGKAYQICSSEDNATMHVNLLTDDYLQPTKKYKRVFIGQSREAPAVFKRNDKYYMITSGCSGWDPNQAKLAIADSMFGEWTIIGDPCMGKDSKMTFFSQSTHFLPIEGKQDAYIAMFDRWNKKNLIDSRYVWLPVTFDGNQITIPWKDEWNMQEFDKK